MRFDSLDIAFKSSGYLTETLLDPEFGHAYEANKTAFNKAYNVNEDSWSWLERPENRLHLVRFGAAMNGLKNACPAYAILEGSLTLLQTLYAAVSPSKLLQGMTGNSFLRARLLSMSEAVLARSH